MVREEWRILSFVKSSETVHFHNGNANGDIAIHQKTLITQLLTRERGRTANFVFDRRQVQVMEIHYTSPLLCLSRGEDRRASHYYTHAPPLPQE